MIRSRTWPAMASRRAPSGLREAYQAAVRSRLRPGRITATRPGVLGLAALIDLPAWCHLTGHHYLGPVPASASPTYALRTIYAPAATDPNSPGGAVPDPGRGPGWPVQRMSVTIGVAADRLRLLPPFIELAKTTLVAGDRTSPAGLKAGRARGTGC